MVESLSILGLPGGPGVKVPVGNAVGIAGEAAVADLTFKDFNATGCTGTLVLDSLLFAPTPSAVSEIGHHHPRLRRRARAGSRLGADATQRVIVDNSKVELVSCLLAGGDGHNNLGFSAYAGDGESAVTILGGGRVYAALSQATGGEGGDFTNFGSSGYGGEGGDGIDVADGDLLLLGRGQELIKGGKGGASLSIYGYGGDGGAGISVKAGSSVRHSNVKLVGGKGGNAIGYIGYSGSEGQPVQVFTGGSAAQATPPDPALERTAVAQAGGIGQIKLRTKPGVFSRLFVGNVPIIQPSANVFVDNLVVKEASYALGFAPANGVVNASFPLDPSWTPGTVVYAQAMSIFPGGRSAAPTRCRWSCTDPGSAPARGRSQIGALAGQAAVLAL